MTELTVPEAGRTPLATAFAHRSAALESWPGFRGLEVWADAAEPSNLMMSSWWDDNACFAAFVPSQNHRGSNARTPVGDHRPKPTRFRRRLVIAQ